VPARKIVYRRLFRPSNAPAEVQRSRIDRRCFCAISFSMRVVSA